jgi:uncharacterized protein (DUF1778 family)
MTRVKEVMVMSKTEVKSARLQLRATQHQREILNRAAEQQSVNPSTFVLESAMAAADHVLAERRVFALDPESWAAFMEVLDAPAKERPNLRNLLQTPSVLEEE